MRDELFDLLLNFVIKMTDEDKVTVLTLSNVGHFEILLINDSDLKNQLKISLHYDGYNTFTGPVSPINRLSLELVVGCLSVLKKDSEDAKSYDDLLRLFMSCFNYGKRHSSNADIYHQTFTHFIDLNALERKNWKKSMTDIEKEVDESVDIKSAKENFQRTREVALNQLTLRHRHQGYKIT